MSETSMTYTGYASNSSALESANKIIRHLCWPDEAQEIHGYSTNELLDGINKNSKVEYINLHNDRITFNTTCSVTDNPDVALLRALATVGVRYVEVEIFNSQVGEHWSEYFDAGSGVDFEDIQQQLSEIAPSINLKVRLESLFWDYEREEALELIENTQGPINMADMVDFLDEVISHDTESLAVAILKKITPLDHDSQVMLLVTALSGGKSDVVEQLLLMGVDPNIKDKGSNLPIYVEYDYGFTPRIVEALAKHGADLDFTLPDRGSLLYRSYENENPDVPRTLERLGSRYVVPDYLERYDGYSIEDMVRDNNLGALKQWRESRDMTAFLQTDEFDDCLGSAIYYGRPEIIEQEFSTVLDPFLMVHKGKEYEQTLLQYASTCEHPHSLRFFLARVKEQPGEKEQVILADVLESIDENEKFVDCVAMINSLLVR